MEDVCGRTEKAEGGGEGQQRKILLSSNDRKQGKPQGLRNGINVLVIIRRAGTS